jgi:hypothetical protein
MYDTTRTAYGTSSGAPLAPSAAAPSASPHPQGVLDRIRGAASYVQLAELRDELKDEWRLRRKVCTAGAVVALIVVLLFSLASGLLVRLFGGDDCGRECDLANVVGAFCDPPSQTCGIVCLDAHWEDDDALDAMRAGGAAGGRRLAPATPEESVRAPVAGAGGRDPSVLWPGMDACANLEARLGGRTIGPIGASMLAKGIAREPRLRTVAMWENGAGDEGSAAVCDAAARHRGLRTLRLAGQGITDAGAAAVAGLIARSESLRTLDVSDNRIGNDGAEKLAAALRENDDLKIFNLWRNRIGTRGALAFAESFRYNLRLKELVLSFNEIDDGGVGAQALQAAEDDRDSLSITWTEADR